MTPGEITLASDVFGDSLDYGKVKVHNYAYSIVQPKFVVMTPNGEIFAPVSRYSDDYSTQSDDYKSLFIHEMAHVWQWQRKITQVRFAAVREWVSRKGDYDAAYQYTLSEDVEFKVHYGLEQQACIIEDYWRVVKNDMPFSRFRAGKYSGQDRIQNIGLTRAEKTLLLLKVLNSFITNPAY